MQTDGGKDTTKLIVTFRNFAKAPRNHTASHATCHHSKNLEYLTTLIIFERFRHIIRMDEETGKCY
jgi:hypothetical protein